MAKRTKATQTSAQLFPNTGSGPARPRQHRALFLPRYLADAARAQSLQGRSQDNAYAVLSKWADLEAAGQLPTVKETKLDALFLKEVFGDALGYALFTDSPTDHQLSIKWDVPGIGTADGALGDFPDAPSPTAVIELKGSMTDLDRDKSSGRTAVQQCWDYLDGLPDCPWGIVSNFSVIRLYHRARTPRAYQEFTLRQLRNRARFNEFYCLFERGGLLARGKVSPARAAVLLDKTATNEEEVGDKLYAEYQQWRNRLIAHFVHQLQKPFDSAIRIAQKLLDRVIFIAFCEDRGLLPEQSLEKAWAYEPPFRRAHNQKWQNFLGLFHEVDQGGQGVGLHVGFNGGLFRHDPDLDGIDLEDIPWVNAFKGFGRYDFKDEVNVDVLGHLFERSITELEKLRIGGLFALTQGVEGAEEGGAEGAASAMPKSAQRKRFGIYYTPPAFTGLIVDRTVETLIRERFDSLAASHQVDADSGKTAGGEPRPQFWKDSLKALRDLKIVDPACGSGAFLIRAYDSLEHHYAWAVDGLISSGGVSPAELNGIEQQIADWILADNLHGVDVSQEAVEITQLALWIRSARLNRTLADLAKNIVCGNSLVDDPAVHDRAMDWRSTFPAVFARPGERSGFDCVVGNPPWERVKLQEREFFSITDPITAESVSAADRRARIAAMPAANPDLYAAYQRALDQAGRTLTYARKSGRYPLTGKGDVNTYVLFAELARAIVAPAGIIGILVPSGIATDETTSELFAALMTDQSLSLLYDFENKRPWFPDVHRSFKFTALIFGGNARKSPKADFVFFAREFEDLLQKRRHIPLTAADLKLLNPNTRTCPIFRSRHDADLTKAIYRRIPILIDHSRKSGGNPWGIRFLRMFDQTNDAEKFRTEDQLKTDGFKLRGNQFHKGKRRFLPLYEAKMVQAYDHRAASVVVAEANWMRQGQKDRTIPVQHQNPEHLVQPRFWVDEAAVLATLGGNHRPGFIGFKDITSATNERTMIAAAAPWAGFTNHFVLILTEQPPCLELCLLANLNSLALDYVTRQKVGAVTLNFFIVEQLPTLPPGRYADRCPWSKRETLERWISQRVLQLTCTADDTIPLADACGFKGSGGDGVHAWTRPERADLRAELDAAFFRLYEIEREDVEYILDQFTRTRQSDAQPLAPSGSPRDLILEHFEGLAAHR